MPTKADLVQNGLYDYPGWLFAGALLHYADDAEFTENEAEAIAVAYNGEIIDDEPPDHIHTRLVNKFRVLGAMPAVDDGLMEDVVMVNGTFYVYDGAWTATGFSLSILNGTLFDEAAPGDYILRKTAEGVWTPVATGGSGGGNPFDDGSID